MCEDPSLTSNITSPGICLYPVPVEDKFQIVSDDLMSWSVINMQGFELLSGYENVVQVSSLQSGFYLMRIKSRANEVFVKSFIKK